MVFCVNCLLEHQKWQLLLKINSWLLRAKDTEDKLLWSWQLNNSFKQEPVSIKLTSVELREAITIKKPLLQRILLWAKGHKNWTLKGCQNVLCTDESKSELFVNMRRDYLKRKPGERLNCKDVIPTVEHCGGSVIMSTCFCWEG